MLIRRPSAQSIFAAEEENMGSPARARDSKGRRLQSWAQSFYRRNKLRIFLAACAAMLLLISVNHDLVGKRLLVVGPPPLLSRWAKFVNPENVLPEYPRPNMRRGQWQNLNGIWQLTEVKEPSRAPPFGKQLRERILVPFPVESYLSGVGRYINRMWYRREFLVPLEWLGAGQRVKLHFGAVDWESTVYVNEQLMGSHRGGYDGFSYDITDVLNDSGANEILVKVYDPTDKGDGVPLGKQRSETGSRLPVGSTNILYTSSSGIWRTVWLEPMPEAHIVRVTFVPDVDQSSVSLLVQGSPAASGMLVKVSIEEELHGASAAAASCLVGERVSIFIPRQRLWSPDDPHLYQVTLQLVERSSDDSIRGPRNVGDQVTSYFGMRKVSVAKDKNGRPRIKLNNKVEMQIGLLDQGFWPDGLYTAPTDAALAYDIQAAKEMGFNLLRKHIKVESDRWYYHADRLGILVWQDMPSMCGMQKGSWGSDWYKTCFNSNRSIDADSKEQFELEMTRHIDNLVNYPSVIAYVIFNEGWGQYETVRVTKKAMALDPNRIYNGASGWTDAAVGNLIDLHDYQGIHPPKPNGTRASVLGEFGGLGLNIPAHTFMRGKDASSYMMFDDQAKLTAYYLDYLIDVKRFMLDPIYSLSAVVYTELTDVEHEVNGWLTYDREVMKADAAVLRKAHADIIAASRNI